MVYEKTGGLIVGGMLSGSVSVGAAGAAATALMIVGARMMVTPPQVEPGYHVHHDHADVVGGALVFGVGCAALYSTVRTFIELRRVL